MTLKAKKAAVPCDGLLPIRMGWREQGKGTGRPALQRVVASSLGWSAGVRVRESAPPIPLCVYLILINRQSIIPAYAYMRTTTR